MSKENDYLPSRLTKMVANPRTLPTRSGPRKLPVIVIYHKDDNFDHANRAMSMSIGKIIADGGNPGCIMSSVVFAWFDTEDSTIAERRCEVTARALQGLVKSEAKVLYGNVDAVYGNFGTPQRIHAGPFIRHVGQLLAILNEMAFGDIRKTPLAESK